MAATAQLRKIGEGREAEMFEWEDGKIVRLVRGENAEEQVSWQQFTLGLAAASGVRVPHVYGRVEVEGRPGLVMERIDGIDLLTMIGKQPWKVWEIAKTAARVHAAMHEAAAPPEAPLLKKRIRRLATDSDLVPSDIRDFALEALDELPDGDRLCHGDFHVGNILMQGGEPVVIDWPAVTRGDPAADVARTWLMNRLGALPPNSGVVTKTVAQFGRKILLYAYLREYHKSRSLDMSLMRRWAAVRVADRLAEGIEEERDALLRFVREAMRAKHGRKPAGAS